MADLPYSETGLAHQLDELKGTQLHLWLLHQIAVNAGTMTVLKDDIALRWLQGQSQQLVKLVESIDEAAAKAWEIRDTARRHTEQRQQHQKQF